MIFDELLGYRCIVVMGDTDTLFVARKIADAHNRSLFHEGHYNGDKYRMWLDIVQRRPLCVVHSPGMLDRLHLLKGMDDAVMVYVTNQPGQTKLAEVLPIVEVEAGQPQKKATPTPAPLLEVLTRTYKRPEMLKINRASLDALTSDDWEQTLFIDDEGIGVDAAQELFAIYPPVGAYVWILDDDDECIHPELVNELQQIVTDYNPDVIMLKMKVNGRTMPPLKLWGSLPECGHVAVSCYIVSREVWMQHRHAWTPGKYESDCLFIQDVFNGGHEVYWHNVTASRTQRVSKGKPE